MKEQKEIINLVRRHSADEFVFVDVGAKGVLEYIPLLSDLTEMHAFEPNPAAFEELEKKYKNSDLKKLFLNQSALMDNKIPTTLFVSQKASMSSLLEPDMHNYQKHFGEDNEFSNWEKGMEIEKKIDLKPESLDSYFENIEKKN